MSEATEEEQERLKVMPDVDFGPKTRPIAYVCHVPRITALAREYGYAINRNPSAPLAICLAFLRAKGVSVE